MIDLKKYTVVFNLLWRCRAIFRGKNWHFYRVVRNCVGMWQLWCENTPSEKLVTGQKNSMVHQLIQCRNLYNVGGTILWTTTTMIETACPSGVLHGRLYPRIRSFVLCLISDLMRITLMYCCCDQELPEAASAAERYPSHSKELCSIPQAEELALVEALHKGTQFTLSRFHSIIQTSLSF